MNRPKRKPARPPKGSPGPATRLYGTASKLARAERQAASLRAQRDAEILEAFGAGVKQAAIARIAGVDRAQVHRLVH